MDALFYVNRSVAPTTVSRSDGNSSDAARTYIRSTDCAMFRRGGLSVASVRPRPVEDMWMSKPPFGSPAQDRLWFRSTRVVRRSRLTTPGHVIPAKAGIQSSLERGWIAACAAMTERARVARKTGLPVGGLTGHEKKAASGFEPENGGFADLCLTTWLSRPKKKKRETRLELATATLARWCSTN